METENVEITEPTPVEIKKPKVKAPRTTAQQETFRKAVATLKARREAEKEEKARKKAEDTLKKVESKVDELRSKAKPVVPVPASLPVAAAAPESTTPPFDMLAHFEKMLDAKLAHLKHPAAPEVHQPIVIKAMKTKKPKKTYIVEEDASSSEDEFPPQPPPARRTAYGTNPIRSAPLQNAWYESLFPQRR